MNSRHKRLLGVLASLLFLTLGIGLYIFVLVHERHFWSIFTIFGLLFLMVITPACCFGYNVNNEIQYSVNEHLDEQTILNYRDIGYGLAIIFYFLTYLMATVAWYSSNGMNPTWIGACLLFYGNMFVMFAFTGFVKIKVYGGNGGEDKK